MMREFYDFEHLAWDEPKSRRALGELLADGRLGRVWVIARDGGDVGYMVVAFGFSLEFGGRDAFLDELYVREGQRGGGIGRRAIETALEACREDGIHALHLEVERKNEAAQGFYRRLGFREHDRFLMTRWIAGEPTF